jgi:hypothetical protein
MRMFLRTTGSAVFCVAIVVGSTALEAAPQPPAKDTTERDLPVSVDRIARQLSKPAPIELKVDTQTLPVATFRVSVEQRVYVRPFKEWLEKEFELNDLQRQSADWASRCCGINLGPLFQKLEDTQRRHAVRKIREQIARELDEIQAARKKTGT